MTQVDDFILIALKNAIKVYIKTGMKVNSSYTPTNMLKKAGEITGKTYKRGQLPMALEDLQAEYNKRIEAYQAASNAQLEEDSLQAEIDHRVDFQYGRIGYD